MFIVDQHSQKADRHWYQVTHDLHKLFIDLDHRYPIQKYNQHFRLLQALELVESFYSHKDVQYLL